MPVPYRSIPVGTRFGRWVVVGAPSRSPTRRYVYPCRCDCGTEREVAEGGLKSGRSASCGCLNREIISGPRLPLRDRFLAKVRQLPNGCWLWLGHKDPHGYGRVGNAEHAYYRDGVRIYCRTCERENQRARYRRKTVKGQPDGTSHPE